MSRQRRVTVEVSESSARAAGSSHPNAPMDVRPVEPRSAAADPLPDFVTAWLGEHVGTCVYRLFDGSGGLLYVGVTNRGHGRLSDHGRSKDWWSEVATATFQHFPSRPMALAAESAAIRGERPRYNVQRGKRSDPMSFLAPDEFSAALELQARRHFDCDGEELRRRLNAGEIGRDDPRLKYVANLLGPT